MHNRKGECKSYPENSSTSKLSEHIPSGFSMPTISSYRIIEDKHNMHRGKDFRKKICKFLRVHTMKIIIFKKKLLTKEQQESYENSKICYTCKKNLKMNIWKIKSIVKLEIIVIIQGDIKATRIDKNGEEITKDISYILQFIDSERSMTSLLSILLIIYLKDLIELNVD